MAILLSSDILKVLQFIAVLLDSELANMAADVTITESGTLNGAAGRKCWLAVTIEMECDCLQAAAQKLEGTCSIRWRPCCIPLSVWTDAVHSFAASVQDGGRVVSRVLLRACAVGKDLSVVRV